MSDYTQNILTNELITNIIYMTIILYYFNCIPVIWMLNVGKNSIAWRMIERLYISDIAKQESVSGNSLKGAFLLHGAMLVIIISGSGAIWAGGNIGFY